MKDWKSNLPAISDNSRPKVTFFPHGGYKVENLIGSFGRGHATFDQKGRMREALANTTVVRRSKLAWDDIEEAARRAVKEARDGQPWVDLFPLELDIVMRFINGHSNHWRREYDSVQLFVLDANNCRVKFPTVAAINKNFVAALTHAAGHMEEVRKACNHLKELIQAK